MRGPAIAMDATAALASVAIIVSAAEWWTTRALFEDGDLLSWGVSRHRARYLVRGPVASVLDRLLRLHLFTVSFPIRAVLAACAGLPILPLRLRAVLWVLVFVALALGAIRSPYGQDGADQMMMLSALTLAAVGLVATDIAALLGVWFLSLQLALSYVTAGVSKLLSPVWRSGQALPLVFRTRMYGHPGLSTFLTDHPQFATGAGWAIILAEVAYPLAFVLPASAALMYLGTMFAFHVGTAVFMGLNTFLLAFVAVYPAAIYVFLR